MSATASAIIYGCVAGAATCIGIGLLLWKEDWARRANSVLNAFAAGVIMATVFLHLLPEAHHLATGEHELGQTHVDELHTDRVDEPGPPPLDLDREGHAGGQGYLWYALGGFTLFFLLENLLIIHGGPETVVHDSHKSGAHAHHHVSPRAMVATLGIGAHSLIDGLIIGVGFHVSPEVGLITTLSVVLHEFPEGIATLSVLYSSDAPRRTATIYAFAVALATPVGAVASVFVFGSIAAPVVGAMLAAGAGTFLYVAASDLIPAAHAQGSRLNFVAFLGGLAFLVLSAALFTH